MEKKIKNEIGKLLNNLTVDASVSYKEDGAVYIRVAPWNESGDITDKPRNIHGRMIYASRRGEGDGGYFIPYNKTGKTLFNTLLKTPHGELKTTPKRVMMQFSFWKSEDKDFCMREFYKEMMQMRQFIKSNKENIEWEKMK